MVKNKLSNSGTRTANAWPEKSPFFGAPNQDEEKFDRHAPRNPRPLGRDRGGAIYKMN